MWNSRRILGCTSRLISPRGQVQAPSSPSNPSSLTGPSESNPKPTMASNEFTKLKTTNGQGNINDLSTELIHGINARRYMNSAAVQLLSTFESTRDQKARSFYTFKYRDYYSQGLTKTTDGSKDNQVSSLRNWSCTGRRVNNNKRGDTIALAALFTVGWVVDRHVRSHANT
jgi:hypothetical protein